MALTYEYDAVVLSVTDGDTVKLSVRLRRSQAHDRDLGFHVMFEDGYVVCHESMRLLGINAPEKNTEAGKEALAYLRRKLPVDKVVRIKTERDRTEKYGRFLVTIFEGDKTINDKLVAAGHAVYWDGHGPRPVPGG